MKRTIALITVLVLALAGCAPVSSANPDEPYETFTSGYFSAESSTDWAPGEIPDDLLPPDPLSDNYRGWEWGMSAPGGYTAIGRLQVGDIVRAGTLHPQSVSVCTDGSTDCDLIDRTSEDFAAGEICGADPETDAAVPLILSLEATTADFPAVIAGGITASIRRGDGDYLEMARAVTIEVKSGTWTDCDDSSGGAASMSMASVDPLENGGTIRVAMFLIIPEYYGPANPAGDPAILDLIEFSPRMSAFGDSGMWQLTAGSEQYKDHGAERVSAGNPPYALSGR